MPGPLVLLEQGRNHVESADSAIVKGEEQRLAGVPAFRRGCLGSRSRGCDSFQMPFENRAGQFVQGGGAARKATAIRVGSLHDVMIHQRGSFHYQTRPSIYPK